MADPLLSFLPAWIASNSVEAPLLLVGEGEHVFAAYVRVAKAAAVCTQKKDGVPCFTCMACTQAQEGTHPDILVLQREKETISVKEIKRCLSGLSYRGFHGRHLVILPEIDRLSPAGAATLLKTLEESSPEVRFLLTTSHKRAVLATILSRCQVRRVEGTPSLVPPSVPLPLLSEGVESLSAEQLATIGTLLRTSLRQKGANPALVRSYMRLRDYYKIRSKRGNEKLATAVLLATLEKIKS